MLRLSHYTAVLSLPLMGATALSIGGAATWVPPLVLFGLVPLAELFLKGSPTNPSAEEESARRTNWTFDLMLFAAIPLQLGMVGLLSYGVAHEWWSGVSLAGAVFTTGICGGVLGINVAHELGHRTQRLHRVGAWILLTSTAYLHFYIEHNRGHHARVATPDDPATARPGETVYGFWVRSVRDSWRSAWAIEQRRLSGRPHRLWDNQMVRITAVQVGFAAMVAAIGGWAVLLAWLASAAVAILLLETVNYVEHYGLSREKTASGRYERVQPHHSWNSEHPIGRVLLFDLTRHSDHHANPGRPYPILRHHDAAPELPTGYPGMVLLALLPPVFQAVMARQLAKETARLQALSAAA